MKDNGVVYPDFSHLFESSPNQHWPLALAFHESPERYYMCRLHGYDDAGVNALVSRVVREYDRQTRGADTVVLSAEAFGNLSKEGLIRLKEWLSPRFADITPVFYARPPGFNSFYSMLQEFVKGGACPSAEDVVSRPVFLQVEQARKIEAVFPNVIFRVFDQKLLFNSDLFEDFFYASGLPRKVFPDRVASSNASLRVECLAFLYLFNKYSGANQQEKFFVRKALVRASRKFREKFSAPVSPCSSWDRELVSRFREPWSWYLQKAGFNLGASCHPCGSATCGRGSVRGLPRLFSGDAVEIWLSEYRLSETDIKEIMPEENFQVIKELVAGSRAVFR